MIKTHTQFINKVRDIFGNDYEILGVFIDFETPIKVRHNICGYRYEITPTDFLKKYRCPNVDCVTNSNYNTHNKKYSIDENFFSSWSPNMSYILGYIYADGNLDKSKYRLRISSIDENHLLKINKVLGSTRPIMKESNKIGNWSTLAVDNRQIYNDLISLGVTPNKSFTCTIPDIPSQYKYDFIRGVFDGDGHIASTYKSGSTIPSMNIELVTASSDFKNSLYNLLTDVTDTYHKFSISIKRDKYFYLRCSSVVAERLYNKMYYDGCLHLERKKERFDSLILLRKNRKMAPLKIHTV